MLAFDLLDTPLGWMGIVSSSSGLKKLILPQKSKDVVLDQIFSCGCTIESHHPDCFGDLVHRLKRYLEGGPVDFPDRLDLAGATCFQQNVWHVTRTIPYGETKSYGWVSNKLCLPKGARAVGQALGKNPLPIVVPCHRVIGGNGSLGGFSGGVTLKEFLLHLEGAYSK